jgi:hypothetical protein
MFHMKHCGSLQVPLSTNLSRDPAAFDGSWATPGFLCVGEVGCRAWSVGRRSCVAGRADSVGPGSVLGGLGSRWERNLGVGDLQPTNHAVYFHALYRPRTRAAPKFARGTPPLLHRPGLHMSPPRQPHTPHQLTRWLNVRSPRTAPTDPPRPVAPSPVSSSTRQEARNSAHPDRGDDGRSGAGQVWPAQGRGVRDTTAEVLHSRGIASSAGSTTSP